LAGVDSQMLARNHERMQHATCSSHITCICTGNAGHDVCGSCIIVHADHHPHAAHTRTCAKHNVVRDTASRALAAAVLVACHTAALLLPCIAAFVLSPGGAEISTLHCRSTMSGTHAPRTDTLCGVSPTWPITATPASTMARAASTRAGLPPAGHTASSSSSSNGDEDAAW
jgi:hypothetical protein